MKIERQQVGTVEVLAPVGPLVEDDAREFCNALMKRVAGPSPRVIVSLQECPYMDSTALEGLVAVSEDLGQRALNLKLVEVPATCREILELTGLSNRFRFFQDTQDAVKSFL